MSPITTHVLDLARGRPAAGIAVKLEAEQGGEWKLVGQSTTDNDGRARDLMPSDSPIHTGSYRISFELEPYFRENGVQSFYPVVTVTFSVRESEKHYHVPLLVSPWGYSTYRGS